VSFDVQTGHDIVDALAAGEFALYYQPIINVKSAIVTKAEALVRWIHPEQGVIPPDEFIRRAEQTGTITALGDWILGQACRDAATWEPNADGQPITVSVNASGHELHDASYADRVLAHLASVALTPDRLVIELVETDYNTASAVVAANLARLVGSGVCLAIDDFGTGHSSLSRLQHTPVNVLKIDRSFITPITHRDQAAPLVTAILAMARELNLDVIVEGIETVEQAAWLRDNGAIYAQGYLYGRPAPGPPRLSTRRKVGEGNLAVTGGTGAGDGGVTVSGRVWASPAR
jgi:EAL domain-containing protein (putative c-di-GMP-specific phosphodiesterase class I)